MKVRTFLFILMLMGLVYALASLFVSNQDVLTRGIDFWGVGELPVGLALLAFLVVGIVVTLLAGMTDEFAKILERRRKRRESRRMEEIEEEYSRGLVAVLEGREDEALRHFRAVLERDSRHFNTLLKIGEVMRSQGRVEEALEYHRKAHHLKEDDTRPLYAMCEDYEARGDLQQARAALGKIIAINRHSVSAWRKLRSLHVKERNWEKALEAHERVEKYAGEDHGDEADRRYGPGIRYQMAVRKLEEGKARDAVHALRRILKGAPGFIPAHVKLGEALCRADSEEEGVEAWVQGFATTGAPVFLSVLEEHYLEHERPFDAIETLKGFVGKPGRDVLARFHLGKLYFRLEMLDDALVVLSSLQGRAAYAPALHFLLGRIHERRKNYREAAAEYGRVLREADLSELEYRCSSCNETFSEWADRCPSCGQWNTVGPNFREDLSLDDLGLSPAPVYTSRS